MTRPRHPGETYRCRRCKKWWTVPPGPRLHCAVVHQEGECCHYGDREATETEIEWYKSGWIDVSLSDIVID